MKYFGYDLQLSNNTAALFDTTWPLEWDLVILLLILLLCEGAKPIVISRAGSCPAVDAIFEGISPLG